METKPLLYGLIGFFLGGLLVSIVATTIEKDTEPVKKNESVTQQKEVKKGDDDKFASLQGDKFDEAYIADMLAHHEGAVNMAEQAQAVTAHEEIRTMAGEITRTQSEEMIQMREWQKEWGYEVTNSGGHMSHGGHGAEMSGDMVEMQQLMQGLVGEEYDKVFLQQMIIHHQQAVDMSRYADTNAKHQDIKDLAKAVISAQNEEITQMKAWQKEWGY